MVKTKEMKKKYTALLILGVMAASMTACSSSHDHATGEKWNADQKEHWKVCEECGEKVELAAHAFDEYDYCEVCNTSVIVDDSYGYTILSYDDQGTLSCQTDYDEEGNVLSELRYENEYYEDGNPKHTSEYYNDVLCSESNYLPCENQEIAEVYMNEGVTYNEDGSKFVSIFNENFMLLSYTEYDPEGNVVSADVYEYTYDDNGKLVRQICKTNDVISSDATYELDEDGNEYLAHEIFYDDNGEVIMDMVYDSNGNSVE